MHSYEPFSQSHPCVTSPKAAGDRAPIERPSTGTFEGRAARFGHRLTAANPIQAKRGGRIGRKKLAKFLYPQPRPEQAEVAREQAPEQPEPAPVPSVLPLRTDGPDRGPTSASREKGRKTRRKQIRRQRALDKSMGRHAGPLTQGNPDQEVLDVTHTVNPLTKRELDRTPGFGKVNPHRIRTMQASIAPHFSNEEETPLSQGIRNLRDKENPYQPKPIRVFHVQDHPHAEDGIYTLDHRRLYTHRKANKQIPFEVEDPKKAMKEKFKFSTHDSGMSMKVATRPIPYVEHTGFGEPLSDSEDQPSEDEFE